MIDFTLFGLSMRDRRVYDAIISHDLASIRSIADETGINRGSVYEPIKALAGAGLVSQMTVGKSVRCKAENPEKLHEIINERRRELMDAHDDVTEYVRSLGLGRHEPGAFGFVSFYEGDEGMANILRDILATCRTKDAAAYKVISSPRIAEYLYVNFRHYTRERIARGVQVKVLRQSAVADGDIEMAEWRLLPKTDGDGSSYSVIYGGKVAIVSINSYNHTSGIVIDNEGVARSQEQLFDIAWTAGDTPDQGVIWTR